MLLDIIKKFELDAQNFDIANKDLQRNLFLAAEKLMENFSLKELKDLDKNAKRFPILFALALKIAISKLVIDKFDKKLKETNEKKEIDVVFAVYKEHNRIKTREENPYGEDFLNVKYEQMKWLFNNTNFDWNLIVVDDGCPFSSGKLAEKIVKEKKYENVKVLYLKDILGKKPLKDLRSTDESKKGGSILYGIYYSLNNFSKELDKKIIIYTDADLSTHLSQIGYLIENLLNNSKKMSIGSRREDNSVVIKKGVRNYRGKLFIYFWKKILPILDFIVDTQCAFKAFRGDFVRDLIENNIEKQFAFDIELILKAALKDKEKIDVKGIVWIDSDKESNTKDSDLYLEMLKSVVKMALRYTKLSERELEYINFISNLTKEDWEKLVENVPKEIIEGNPKEFNKLELLEKFEKIIKK